MIAKIRREIDRSWFNFKCARIFDTPPIKCDPNSNVLIVSQLHHPDMTMYLLAAKSLARFVGARSYVIVDDGLLADDRRILSEHFESIRFMPRNSIKLDSCPAGGCWERLLALSDENSSHYVIQLDADILTLAEPTEVLHAVAQERTFTLGTSSGTHFVSFSEASRNAHISKHEHVQNYAERALDQYPGKEHLKYVRGCAGFTGFARGRLSRERIEDFSIHMEKLLGEDKWNEWGTEQVTSNYMAANARDSFVLPVDRYPFWKPGLDIESAVLIHFFGTFRFSRGMYLDQARKVIKALVA